MPNVRTTAASLLADADLYTDPDQPVHGVADLADALDVPVTAVRTAAVEAGAPRVGNALALTKKLALDVAEQLDAIGWSLGGTDEADEDEADDEFDADEAFDDEDLEDEDD